MGPTDGASELPQTTPAEVTGAEPIVDVASAEQRAIDATPALEPTLTPPNPDGSSSVITTNGEVANAWNAAEVPAVDYPRPEIEAAPAAPTETPVAIEPVLEQPVADPALVADSAPAEPEPAANPTSSDNFGKEDGMPAPEPDPVAAAVEPTIAPAEPVMATEATVTPVELTQSEPALEVAPVDPTLTGAASPDVPTEPSAIPGEAPAVTPTATQEEQKPSFISRLLGLVGI
jgi:hypothetical protein